jgi:beta-glucanase (GH16 family)
MEEDRSDQSSAAGPGPRRRRRRPWLAVLAVLVLAGGVLTVVLHRGSGTADPGPAAAGPGSSASASDPAAPAISTSESASASTPVSTPASAAAAPSASTPPIAGPWHLAFEDDFTGSSLDTNRWVTCYDWNQGGCTNAGNHEIEWYLPSQVGVANGAMTLTAQRRPTTGLGGQVYPWTSGMLSTGRSFWTAKPHFTFTYGYIEASIKMPAATGVFPAFWLLSADESGAPEIDVVEMIGSHTTAFMNLHWNTATGVPAEAPSTFGPVDFSAGYHDFAVDWEPGHLVWYIDGVARYSIADGAVVPTVPMEIIFTLAVGVPQAPPADVSTASVSVDHIRLWQH